MISAIFNRETTQSSLYRDGAEYHVTVQVDRKMLRADETNNPAEIREDNVDKFLIVYTINGRATLIERHANKSLHGYPTFCPSERMAYQIGMKLAQIEIEDYLRSLVYAEPRTPDEQLMTICYMLRHGTELGKLVNTVYPSSKYKLIRIWVRNNQNKRTIQSAIANLQEGIQIKFYLGYPN